MSFSFANFDPDAAIANAPESSYNPIPTGWYPTVITDTERKATQKGGEMLILCAEVIDGPYKGKKSWTNFNVECANKKTQDWAQRDIGVITRAVGLYRPKHESELCNRPLMARWVVIPEGEYPAKNEMKDWKPMNATPDMFQGHTHDIDTNAPASDGVNGTPRVGIATGSKKPWEK